MAGRTLRGAPYHVNVRMYEREMVRRALSKAKGAVVRAARALGVPRQFLHRKLDELDIRPAALERRRLRRAAFAASQAATTALGGADADAPAIEERCEFCDQALGACVCEDPS